MSISSFFFSPLRNDGTEFGGSIYQKVNDQLETAVNLAWTAGNSNTRFGIAAKYQIDADAAFSVRGFGFFDSLFYLQYIIYKSAMLTFCGFFTGQGE